ncbi:hypothetical protein J2P12_00715 [Candidatus Bathyarchaeota archaeon]|nr:hypothetical protein [Candidatus Bathyarchaeota archaeon]
MKIGLFVGHFAVAYVLWRLFPQVPLPVALVAVSFPDLIWSVLVPAGVEKVRINPDSPLQKFIVFEKFPYSHSLVLTNVWSLLVGLALAGLLGNPLVALVFVLGSISHWVLDTIVHLKDLPVLGFDGDTKVGVGLWRRGPLAFIVEVAFYVIVSALVLSSVALLLALVVGIVFHIINLPSFFGASKKNSVKTSNGYAALALLGFGAFIAIASILI